MAYTEFGTASPQARKVWGQDLMYETFGKMSVRGLIKKGMGACIQMKTELQKDPGDTIYYDLLAQDRSNGVNGDAQLKGFETPLTFYQDTLVIEQKRHAHANMGMTQQRTVHDLRKSARFSLSEWWAWFYEAGLLAHLAGVAGDGNETVAGALGATSAGDVDFAGNTLFDMTSVSDYYVDGSAASFTLDSIDAAVAKAKTANPRVVPIQGINADYVMYMHPNTVYQLRINTGSQRWTDLQKNAGVRGTNNPIWTGALGLYNNVLLRESEFVPSVGDIRYATLLGQGAGCIAYGNAWASDTRAAAGGGTFFDWKEETDDYGNKRGIAGVSCPGFKGSVFNSKPFGRVLVTSDDPAPA